jgi:hypothetical protein
MNELLNLLFTQRDQFSAIEFEFLVKLIEDGTIVSFEELAEYGVEE